MVAYKPPDRVTLMIGASHRAEPLVAAANRIAPILAKDFGSLGGLGVPENAREELAQLARDVDGMMKDPAVRKHDTPLQMSEAAETMARIRGWLVELRQLAALELSLDAPSLSRVSSPAPEIADGYPRDLLAELQLRVSAAADLKPRLEDVGLTQAFLGEGRKLAQQLSTAIGKQDVDPENLDFKTKRLYMKKAALHALLKRIVRAGQYAFRATPSRARLYHLDELEKVEPGERPAAAPAVVQKPRVR